MKTHRDEIIGVLQLINRKRDRRRCGCSSRRDRRARGAARTTQRCVELVTRARVAGGRRDREQPALRGHRAAVRGIRHRGGHGDRIARSDDVRSLGPRRDAHRRARRGGRSRRRRPVPRRALHARAAARASLRRPAARLRQGRRARAGAGEGEEALPARPRAHPAPLRVSASSARTSSSSASAPSYLLARGRDALRASWSRSSSDERRRDARRAALLPRRDRRAPTSRPCSPEGSFDDAAAASTSAPTSTSTGVERPLLEDHELQFLMIRKGNLDDARAPRDRVARHAHVSASSSRSRGRASCAASRRSPTGITRS